MPDPPAARAVAGIAALFCAAAGAAFAAPPGVPPGFAGRLPPGFGAPGASPFPPDGPARPPAGVVRFSLRNLRVVDDPDELKEHGLAAPLVPGLWAAVAVDWARTGEGRGLPELVVADAGGLSPVRLGRTKTLPYEGEEPGEKSGTAYFAGNWRGPGGKPEVEAFVRTDPVGLPGGVYYVVSNVLTLNGARATVPRALTAEERRRAAAANPPAAAPPGWVAVTADAAPSPGMPVKIGVDGAWVDAEYLAPDGAANASVLPAAPANRAGAGDPVGRVKSVRRGGGWMAVRTADLEKAAANPAAFAPSLRVQPGGSLEMPEGVVPLPDPLPPPGTPVLVEHGGEWVGALLRGPFGSDPKGLRRLRVRKGRGVRSPEAVKARGQVAVRTRILELLENPAVVARYARAAATWQPDGAEE